MTGPPRRPTPIRGAAPLRRRQRVRRASAGLSPTRAGAGLAMLVAVLLVAGFTGSDAFEYSSLDVEGETWTSRSAIVAAVDVPAGTNLFEIRTAPLEAAVEALPAIAEADVSVVLPDRLVVAVVEREPILIWEVGERRYLLDRDGLAIATLASEARLPAGLPVVVDRRGIARGLDTGEHVDPVDLDAASRLASLTPADIGSAAPGLTVEITDEHGYVVRPASDGWFAVFGFYTPTLRTTAMIPGQVRLLRSLLSGREAEVERVILASETDGTYVPRATPAPTPSSQP